MAYEIYEVPIEEFGLTGSACNSCIFSEGGCAGDETPDPDAPGCFKAAKAAGIHFIYAAFREVQPAADQKGGE